MKSRYLSRPIAAVALLCLVAPVWGDSPGTPAPVDANIYSTMPSTDAHRPEMALDSDASTFFETVGGMDDGDDFLVLFSRPIPVTSIKVTTGSGQGHDLLSKGILETTADGDSYHKVADFKAGGVAEAALDNEPVMGIRIRLPKDGSVDKLVIDDIAVTSTVPISHAQLAPGRAFVDVSKAPDVKAWADRAAKEVAEFLPNTDALLYSDGFIPPNMVNMVFSDSDGVAATGGGVMAVNAKWCREHPEDTGLTVHEMSHAVQAYPSYDAGWLVEGIADYIRWVKFEPQHFHPRINVAKSTYHDSYQTTATFLGWCVLHYDSCLPTKLNQALRAGTYNDRLFKQYCGKDVGDLWAEFVKSYQADPKDILAASPQSARVSSSN
jgi:hypothetical protein